MRVAMLKPDVKVIVKCNASPGEVITWANQDTDSLGARSTRHTECVLRTIYREAVNILYNSCPIYSSILYMGCSIIHYGMVHYKHNIYRQIRVVISNDNSLYDTKSVSIRLYIEYDPACFHYDL